MFSLVKDVNNKFKEVPKSYGLYGGCGVVVESGFCALLSWIRKLARGDILNTKGKNFLALMFV